MAQQKELKVSFAELALVAATRGAIGVGQDYFQQTNCQPDNAELLACR